MTPATDSETAGFEGVVDQVREMDDGTYNYVVSSIDDDDPQADNGMIYAEHQLIATGRRLRLSDVPHLANVWGSIGQRGYSIRVHPDGDVRTVGYTIIDWAAHHA